MFFHMLSFSPFLTSHLIRLKGAFITIFKIIGHHGQEEDDHYRNIESTGTIGINMVAQIEKGDNRQAMF